MSGHVAAAPADRIVGVAPDRGSSVDGPMAIDPSGERGYCPKRPSASMAIQRPNKMPKRRMATRPMRRRSCAT